MQICDAKKGTQIDVYDQPYCRYNDDYAEITDLKDIDYCVTIPTFEKTTTYGVSGEVSVRYHPYNTLDGKVSCMKFWRP